MCHFGLVNVCARIHTNRPAQTCARTPLIQSPSEGCAHTHTSRHVLSGVKELRCPLSQSYWAVMTLEDVGFFLSTSVI